MNGIAEPCELPITTLLRESAAHVREVGHHRWKCELSGGVALSVVVQRSGQWLLFRAPLARSNK